MPKKTKTKQKKSNMFDASYLTKRLFEIEFDVLLKHVSLMNCILILSCPVNIQDSEPCLGDFLKETFIVGL